MMANKFNWKITAKKFGFSLIEILAAGTLVYITDKPYLLFLVPVAEAVRNWIKHK